MKTRFNIALELHKKGDLEAAKKIYEKLIPEMAEAYINLGVIHYETGQIEKAIYLYKQALAIKPDCVDVYKNIGNALKKQGRLKKVVQCYQNAIKIMPDNHEMYAYLGNALYCLGNTADAIKSYSRAVSIKPDYGKAYNEMGLVFREQGKADKAEICFFKAIQSGEKIPEACNNAGIIFKEQGDLNKAVKYYRKAIEIKPDFADAYYNLANALAKTTQIDEAIINYRKAILLKPDFGYAVCMLIRQLQHLCDWEELEKTVNKLSALSKNIAPENLKSVEMPFLAFSISSDPCHNFMVAKSCSTAITKKISRLLDSNREKIDFSFKKRIEPESKITIGYLSNDFRNHATGHFMCSLFKLHDRNTFNINCYSHGENDQSIYQKQIENECDKFIDINSLNNLKAAQKIYQDKVDILVDLKGYTKGNRLEICAFRPAPVQVCYLGFPGTTGADFFDYIISDRIISPPEQAPFFSEKFIYLPDCYQVNNFHQKISSKNYLREEFGLPKHGFIFACFNQSYKIEKKIFISWMKILEKTPESVLWLLSKHPVMEVNLRREAKQRDIAPKRLIFTKKLPKEQHLARLKLADLMLDTATVNGHTTTSDALWAGIPVITLLGSHFASRVSASLIKAVGLPELITNNLKEYENLCIRLAKNYKELEALKSKLLQNRLTAPLFNTYDFAKNMDKAFKKIWSGYQSGSMTCRIEI